MFQAAITPLTAFKTTSCSRSTFWRSVHHMTVLLSKCFALNCVGLWQVKQRYDMANIYTYLALANCHSSLAIYFVRPNLWSRLKASSNDKLPKATLNHFKLPTRRSGHFQVIVVKAFEYFEYIDTSLTGLSSRQANHSDCFFMSCSKFLVCSCSNPGPP